MIYDTSYLMGQEVPVLLHTQGFLPFYSIDNIVPAEVIGEIERHQKGNNPEKRKQAALARIAIVALMQARDGKIEYIEMSLAETTAWADTHPLGADSTTDRRQIARAKELIDGGEYAGIVIASRDRGIALTVELLRSQHGTPLFVVAHPNDVTKLNDTLRIHLRFGRAFGRWQPTPLVEANLPVRVRRLILSPDRRLIAIVEWEQNSPSTASQNGTVRVWELSLPARTIDESHIDLRAVMTITARGVVTRCYFGKNNSLIVLTKPALPTDAINPEILTEYLIPLDDRGNRDFKPIHFSVSAAAFFVNPSASRVIAVQQDANTKRYHYHLADLRNVFRPPISIDVNGQAVKEQFFDMNEHKVAERNSCTIYDSRTGHMLGSLPNRRTWPCAVRNISLSPDGRHVVAAFQTNTSISEIDLEVFSLPDLKQVALHRFPGSFVRSIAFSPDSKAAAAIVGVEVYYLHGPRFDQLITLGQQFEHGRRPTTSLKPHDVFFSPDGRRLLSYWGPDLVHHLPSGDHVCHTAVEIWQVPDFVNLVTFEHLWANEVCVDPSGEVAMTFDHDSKVRVWRLDGQGAVMKYLRSCQAHSSRPSAK